MITVEDIKNHHYTRYISFLKLINIETILTEDIITRKIKAYFKHIRNIHVKR